MPHFRCALIKKVVLLVLVMVVGCQMVGGVLEMGDNSLTHHTKERLLASRVKMEIRRKLHYTVRLLLPDETMSPLLNDKSSSRYKDLANTLTNDIQDLFMDTAGDQRVYNMQFSSYKSQYKEHGNLNELGSWQKEIALLPQSADSKPSSFLLSTLSPSQSSPSTRFKKKQKMKVSARTSSPPTARSSTLPSTKPLLIKGKSTERGTSTKAAVITTATTALLTMMNEVTSSQTSALTVSTTKASEKVFDVVLITKMFKECYTTRDYLILLEPYLDAYSELLSIFKLFGPIFAFAEVDIRNKLGTLHNLRKEDLAMNLNNYATFQSMFAYEHSQDGAKAELEGVSANRWIHRALKFISGLIKSALDKSSEKSLGNRAQELYSDILAPHHEWYVRTVAYLALMSFPSRESLMAQMSLTESAEDMQTLADLSSAIEAVYDDVESLYVKYSS